MVYLAFGTILKVLWQFLNAFGLIFIVVNSHTMIKYICHLVTLHGDVVVRQRPFEQKSVDLNFVRIIF